MNDYIITRSYIYVCKIFSKTAHAFMLYIQLNSNDLTTNTDLSCNQFLSRNPVQIINDAADGGVFYRRHHDDGRNSRQEAVEQQATRTQKRCAES